MSITKSVPFFNYPAMYLERDSEYLKAIENALGRGAFIMQQELADFETDFASYLGCKHAIGVADGTAALELSLMAAGIQHGDEVIVSSHTFVATAAAVHHTGGIPVVADCQADGMIDSKSVRKLVGPKTKILMPTQLNGRTCDMEQLLSIAEDNELKIVEDSCQALGASYDGTKAGLFGIAGSYSFFPAKTLGCFGDGGAVTTDSDEVAALVGQLRDHGRTESGKVTVFGRNGRLDNVQAAVLGIKLKHYDQAISRRREIALKYDEAFRNISDLILPPPPGSDTRRFDVFQNYEIQCGNRDALRAYLAENGIGTIVQWGGWMIHQFDDLNLRCHAPYAEKMSKRYMMLPMHHLLTNEDIAYVSEKVLSFYDLN